MQQSQQENQEHVQSSAQMLQQMQQQSQKQQIELTSQTGHQGTNQQVQQQQQNISNNSNSNTNSKQKAGNQKNTYIKKISTLMEKHVGNSDGQLPPEIEQGGAKVKRNKSQINVQEVEDKFQLKLARNRESARNSRKRKKIYLELLENKVTQLNEFLNESKQINKNSEDLLSDLQKQIQQKNDMSNQKSILFRNLQIALQLQSNASDADINGIIDSLKSRYGTVNKERMEVLDYCYKQIAEQILPIHMQYVLYCCKNKKDIFSEQFQNNKQTEEQNQNEEQEEDFPNIIKTLDFNEKQTRKCQKLSKILTKEKGNLDRQLQQLYDVKEQMKVELQSLDNTFEDLRKEFAPTLIGKFLLEVEKYQYNTNMKKSFDKFFSARANNLDLNIDKTDDDEDDCDSEGDLYEFIKSEDSCNNLMVDINEAYDVYVDAYDFLSKKQKMQNEEQSQKEAERGNSNPN